MPTGKVKWFSSKKGYGFIREEDKERDIFLHVSALENSPWSSSPASDEIINLPPFLRTLWTNLPILSNP